jgi:hypothetical protein
MRSVLALAILALFAAPAAAQEWPVVNSGTEGLRGVREMGVFLTRMPDLDGIPGEVTIRTAIELRLRQNGVRVVGTEKFDSRRPNVAVDVSAIRMDADALVYSVHLDFRRPGQFLVGAEKQPRMLTGRLWEMGYLGYSNTDESKDAIREAVVEVVDAFINKWLEANPKR